MAKVTFSDALARILTNIKLNEGLSKNPQLFLNIANFLRSHVCTVGTHVQWRR